MKYNFNSLVYAVLQNAFQWLKLFLQFLIFIRGEIVFMYTAWSSLTANADTNTSISVKKNFDFFIAISMSIKLYIFYDTYLEL